VPQQKRKKKEGTPHHESLLDHVQQVPLSIHTTTWIKQIDKLAQKIASAW
tara:strand:+ start:103 stop:252 length:150 start_codon:yes stop_codon:yes gene_type:complete